MKDVDFSEWDLGSILKKWIPELYVCLANKVVSDCRFARSKSESDSPKSCDEIWI